MKDVSIASCHENELGEWRCSSVHWHYIEVNGKLHALASFSCGKNPQYALDRRLVGPQRQSWCGKRKSNSIICISQICTITVLVLLKTGSWFWCVVTQWHIYCMLWRLVCWCLHNETDMQLSNIVPQKELLKRISASLLSYSTTSTTKPLFL